MRRYETQEEREITRDWIAKLAYPVVQAYQPCLCSKEMGDQGLRLRIVKEEKMESSCHVCQRV